MGSNTLQKGSETLVLNWNNIIFAYYCKIIEFAYRCLVIFFEIW